jgi:hypothetical protein
MKKSIYLPAIKFNTVVEIEAFVAGRKPDLTVRLVDVQYTLWVETMCAYSARVCTAWMHTLRGVHFF